MIRRALIRADCASTPIIQRFVLRLHSAVIFVQVYAFDDIRLYSLPKKDNWDFSDHTAVVSIYLYRNMNRNLLKHG